MSLDSEKCGQGSDAKEIAKQSAKGSTHNDDCIDPQDVLRHRPEHQKAGTSQQGHDLVRRPSARKRKCAERSRTQKIGYRHGSGVDACDGGSRLQGGMLSDGDLEGGCFVFLTAIVP